MAKDVEKLNLKITNVSRKTKSGDIVKDLKEGYIYFDVTVDANGKKIVIEKRVRLDKPERMLNKFVTKVKAIAEESYKERTYYVAQKTPPSIETSLDNESDVNDRLLPVFEEVNHYIKTSNPSVLATSSVKF